MLQALVGAVSTISQLRAVNAASSASLDMTLRQRIDPLRLLARDTHHFISRLATVYYNQAKETAPQFTKEEVRGPIPRSERCPR